jgi:fructokinase
VIVVVGESLIDVAPDGTESVGGSPLNVAVGLGRLEAPAVLITELGADERADAIRRYVEDAGVELESTPAPGGRTAVALVTYDEGEPAYELDLTWELAHQELPACDALHVGSLATVLEPGRHSVLDLVEQAWALDVFVSYDPNVRAGHLTDHDHDQAWGDIESLADRAHLVKLSEQDVQLLHPGADPETIARALLTGDRTELVLLTRGERGASAFTDGLAVHVPAPPVEVVDTVGAGDAFMAAALTVLLEDGAFSGYGGGLPHEQDSLERLLGAAVTAAAVSCGRAGAATPSRSELPPDWPEPTSGRR